MRNATLVSTFRINTYESVSKQRTLTAFRMNTYAKRGGGRSLLRPPSLAPHSASIPCALTRLRILPVATGVYRAQIPETAPFSSRARCLPVRQRASVACLPQAGKPHVLSSLPPLLSLGALFCTPSLCFQWIAASF